MLKQELYIIINFTKIRRLQRIFSKNKNSEFNYMHILKSQRMSAIPEMFYQGPWYELEYTLDLYLQT